MRLELQCFALKINWWLSNSLQSAAYCLQLAASEAMFSIGQPLASPKRDVYFILFHFISVHFLPIGLAEVWPASTAACHWRLAARKWTKSAEF